MTSILICFQYKSILIIMTRYFLISSKHNLTIISFLALGIASILLLIPHHLNYAYSESYYFIKSKLNGMVLDIRGADPFAGAFVQTWPANGNNNQLWTITSDGFIKSKLNGMVLDIRGADPFAGATIQTWTQNNNLNQQWILEKKE